MADEQNNSGGGGDQQQQQQQVAARPEYMPEKHWDAAKGQPNVEGLARDYTELAQRHAKGKEGLIPVIKQELEAERFKNRPEKPDGYKFEVGKDFKMPEGLVMLKEPPGKDFKPEEGKRYFYVKPDDPMMKFWRETAHRTGMSNDEFMQGIVTYADSTVHAAPTEAQRKEALGAEYKKLGENGPARVVHTFNGLKAAIGEKHAMALDGVPLNATAVEALEALVEKAGGPKFAPQGGGQGGAGAPTMEQVREIQSADDYWTNPDKQNQARDLLGKINAAKGKKAA